MYTPHDVSFLEMPYNPNLTLLVSFHHSHHITKAATVKKNRQQVSMALCEDTDLSIIPYPG